MGQITQIAFELRNLTQAALDDESSDADADEEENTEESKSRRQEIATWVKFCKLKINKIERVWNKKLEDPSNDGEDSEEEPEQAEEPSDDDLSNEENLHQLLDNFDNHRLSRSHVDTRRNDHISQDL